MPFVLVSTQFTIDKRCAAVSLLSNEAMLVLVLVLILILLLVLILILVFVFGVIQCQLAYNKWGLQQQQSAGIKNNTNYARVIATGVALWLLKRRPRLWCLQTVRQRGTSRQTETQRERLGNTGRHLCINSSARTFGYA